MDWQHPVDALRAPPDRIALRFAGESVTYAELERESRAIAAGLVEQGIGREVLIGLALPRSAALAIWCWGAWRAGAAVMPLDPTYPPDRLAYMVDAAKPALVVVDGVVPAWARSARTVDHAAFARSDAAIRVAHHPDDLAYVIYTSGSTGRPKGVEVTARGLVNLARTQAVVFEISPESRILNFASPSFDAYIAELLSALVIGASLHVPSVGEARPGPELAAFCAREAITVATFPPSLLAVLEPRDYPSLRTVVSAGEACSAGVVQRWARGRRFVNAYGPTEATVCATAGQVTIEDVANGVPTIGHVLPGVEALVLDGEMQPVADGEVGELVLGGVGLARGYRGDPAATASGFVAHPRVPGARVYRTGDLVRRDADGRYYFVGRSDDQIKLRGFRIELGEIEHVLRARPEIADAAVVVRSGPRTGDQLIAHVVVRNGAKLDATALHADLAGRLPAFMIPDVVSPIDALPRSPNGKVDRRALPAPRPYRPAGFAPPIAATSPDEAYLVDTFAHALALDAVGVDDDFFALGGHSLAAVVMLARIAEDRGSRLALSQFFEHPTPRALAGLLAARATLPVSIVPLRVGPSSRPPLFLIHPVGGNPSCYLDLAAALADDRPIYGIQNPALAGGPVEPRTIEEICADYVAAIRAVQPRGPYLVGGWSVGGNYAIEVARGLSKHDTVGPLVLLDSWSPLLLPRPRPVLDDGFIAFMFIKNNLGRAAGIDLPITPADTAPLSRDQRMELVRSWAVRLGTLPSDVPLAQLARLVDVFGQTLRAHINYEPVPYLGEVVHIQASSPAIGHPRPPTLGWETVLPNERTIVIPDSTHFVFIYPPLVNQIAPLVRAALGAFT